MADDVTKNIPDVLSGDTDSKHEKCRVKSKTKREAREGRAYQSLCSSSFQRKRSHSCEDERRERFFISCQEHSIRQEEGRFSFKYPSQEDMSLTFIKFFKIKDCRFIREAKLLTPMSVIFTQLETSR